MNKLKDNWQMIVIIVTLIGWGVTVGYYKAKVDTLEKNDAKKEARWEKQIEVDQSQNLNIKELSTTVKLMNE